MFIIGVTIGLVIGNKLRKNVPVVVPSNEIVLIVKDPKVEPIVKAMVNVVEKTNPEDVLFFVGSKPYKAKEVKKHLEKKDEVADVLVKYSLKAVGFEFQIPDESIEKAAKMFETTSVQ